jgi:hypothetical protein
MNKLFLRILSIDVYDLPIKKKGKKAIPLIDAFRKYGTELMKEEGI